MTGCFLEFQDTAFRARQKNLSGYRFSVSFATSPVRIIVLNWSFEYVFRSRVQHFCTRHSSKIAKKRFTAVQIYVVGFFMYCDKLPTTKKNSGALHIMRYIRLLISCLCNVTFTRLSIRFLLLNWLSIGAEPGLQFDNLNRSSTSFEYST